MKPIDPNLRARILELRRSHSLREVADLTGVPLGTVKALCSRASSAGRNNLQHRAFFRLPDPVGTSDSTTIVMAPDLPPKERVTGILDLDAMLWLRKVVSTGDDGHITRALLAVERIKTPAKELEHAYGRYLEETTGNTLSAAFGSMGFADLRGYANNVLQKKRTQAEALAVFGTMEAAFADQPPEVWCIEVCEDVPNDSYGFLDDAAAAKRFDEHPELAPWSLADVKHELDYWDSLDRFRCALSRGLDYMEVSVRRSYMLHRLGKIRPRDRAEALATFEFVGEKWESDSTGFDEVLRHLIGSGWST